MRDIACLQPTAHSSRSHPINADAQAFGNSRATTFAHTLYHSFHDALQHQAYLTDNSAEKQQEFQDGIAKLITELKNNQIAQLKHRLMQPETTPDERKRLSLLIAQLLAIK